MSCKNKSIFKTKQNKINKTKKIKIQTKQNKTKKNKKEKNLKQNKRKIFVFFFKKKISANGERRNGKEEVADFEMRGV